MGGVGLTFVDQWSNLSVPRSTKTSKTLLEFTLLLLGVTLVLESLVAGLAVGGGRVIMVLTCTVELSTCKRRRGTGRKLIVRWWWWWWWW